MTQAQAQTVVAYGAAQNAFPAVKCVRLMKDAGRVLHNAIEELLPALIATTTPKPKTTTTPTPKTAAAEKKLRSALQLVSQFLESQGPLLRTSITALASQDTVRACEMKLSAEHSARLRNSGYKGFEDKPHEKRFRDLAASCA